jgi:hypothetical protein
MGDMSDVSDMREMTSRERVERTLAFEPVDRVALYDLIQHIPYAEHYAGERLTIANALDVVCRAISRSLDLTRGVGAPSEETVFEKDGFVYKREWWTTWELSKPFDDVAGLREFVKRNVDEIQASPPTVTWGFHGGDLQEDFRGDFLRLQEKLNPTVQMLTTSAVGLDIAWYRAGYELFCYLYAEEPDLVSAWLEALCEHEIRRIHSIADPALSPVVLSYADIADKNTTLFSPTFLRREFIPRLRRNVEAWHSHGIKVVFHSDGNLWPILADIVEAGVDGLNPLEPLSQMDLGRVRTAFPRLVLAGGIDASQLLPLGSVEEVRVAVRRAIDLCESGGLLLGSSTETHPACKLENVVAMIETAKEYSRR